MKKILSFTMVMTLVLGVMLGTFTKPADALATAKKTPGISAKELLLTQGKTAVLKMQNFTGTVRWSSSKPKVATVTKKGTVKALKNGTAVITATVSKKKYKCNVTVASKNSKVLIAYFSMTNTTKDAADIIQDLTKGDLVRIQTKKAYTSNYDKLLETAEKELSSDARPAMATVINNIKQYDTVIIGYPIWWGKEPMAIRTFLDTYDLSGKTVVPFCTSGGSGISGSINGIKSLTKGATVLSGRDVTGDSKSAVQSWLESINIQIK